MCYAGAGGCAGRRRRALLLNSANSRSYRALSATAYLVKCS